VSRPSFQLLEGLTCRSFGRRAGFVVQVEVGLRVRALVICLRQGQAAEILGKYRRPVRIRRASDAERAQPQPCRLCDACPAGQRQLLGPGDHIRTGKQRRCTDRRCRLSGHPGAARSRPHPGGGPVEHHWPSWIDRFESEQVRQALYTAEATAIGDGRNGEVRSSDGVIDEQIALTLRAVGGLRLPGRFSFRSRP
jgi:hypothetical protein